MKAALLRLAHGRKLGERRWKAMAGHDPGTFTLRVDNRAVAPLVRGTHFWWDVHEHRGGRGGLDVMAHRDEVRRMVGKLVARNGVAP
jgi:hypothetical protein